MNICYPPEGLCLQIPIPKGVNLFLLDVLCPGGSFESRTEPCPNVLPMFYFSVSKRILDFQFISPFWDLDFFLIVTTGRTGRDQMDGNQKCHLNILVTNTLANNSRRFERISYNFGDFYPYFKKFKLKC